MSQTVQTLPTVVTLGALPPTPIQWQPDSISHVGVKGSDLDTLNGIVRQAVDALGSAGVEVLEIRAGYVDTLMDRLSALQEDLDQRRTGRRANGAVKSNAAPIVVVIGPDVTDAEDLDPQFVDLVREIAKYGRVERVFLIMAGRFIANGLANSTVRANLREIDLDKERSAWD